MGILMLVIVLISAAYITAEADHDCCGDDCPICECIRQCENTLRGLGGRPSAQSAAVAPIIILTAVFIVAAVSKSTLVSKKVRLNN